MNTTYAVVNTSTNLVENIVLVDAALPWRVGPDCQLITIPEGASIGKGWIYNQETTSFSNPNPPSTLADARAAKIEEIDTRTREILAEGFTYNGVVLGLSESDRSNYLGLVIVKDVLTYPYTIKGKANSDYCTIQSAQDMLGLFLTGVSYIDNTLRSGFVHKDAVLQLNDVDDINNYVDPR